MLLRIVFISYVKENISRLHGANYLDHDLDDINLDRDPEDASVYKEHSLFNITKGFTVQWP